MNLLNYNIDQVLLMVFVAFRIGAMFISMPFFSDVKVPMLVPVVLPVMFSAVLTPIIPHPDMAGIHAGFLPFIFSTFTEVSIGLLMGFSVRILFTMATVAGELAGLQIGFAMAGLFDPSLGQVPQLAVLQNAFLIVAFFAFNAHHAFVQTLVQSYYAIPVGTQGMVVVQMVPGLFKVFSGIYLLALRFALPVVAVILMMHIIMGVISIAAPEMNIYFNAAMNINITLGMFILMLSIGTLIRFFQTGTVSVTDFLRGGFLAAG
jgi:flagellar biosynthetic protein FliR